MKTAQKRLGHADVRTTLEVYAQSLEAADRHAAEVLGTHFLGNAAREIGVGGIVPRDSRATGGKSGKRPKGGKAV